MKLLIIENAKGRADGIRSILRRLSIQHTILQPYAKPVPRSNSSENEYDGLVISGGPGRASDIMGSTWYKASLRLIDKFLSDKRPVLGICLGHQILALLHGGKVATTKQNVGWYNIELTCDGTNDQLFSDCNSSFPVFHYNHDEVTDLPKNLIHLAQSERCRIEVFRVAGMMVWGVQSHPEINPLLGRAILETKGIKRDMVIPVNHHSSCIQLFSNFAKLQQNPP